MRLLNKILFNIPGFIAANLVYLMFNLSSDTELTDDEIKRLFPVWE